MTGFSSTKRSAQRRTSSTPEIARFCAKLVYGTSRHRGTLDRLLDHHLRSPIAKQQTVMAWALRLAAYQLVYLTRIPAHAAVFQTLEALKGLGGKAKAVGFANAVLHKLVADVLRKTSDEPEDADDPSVLPVRYGYCFFHRPVMPLVRMNATGHYAVKHAHPEWLVERWLKRFESDETTALLETNNAVAPLSARITARAPARVEVEAALTQDGFEIAAGERDDAIILARGDLENCRALREGWIQMQDETAMTIGAMLTPAAGSRVLDLCAAPGGKAMQLLEKLGEGGHLVAVDRSEKRLETVRDNLSRVGSSAHYTVSTVPASPGEVALRDAAGAEDQFSHVLVDAPCSNTGVLARRPEARWRLRPQDLDVLPKLQLELLEAAYRHLKPGGKLLYSTCSIEPEENEGVVAALVAAHGDLTEIETRYFLPHRAAGDGGFCSLLLRAR